MKKVVRTLLVAVVLLTAMPMVTVEAETRVETPVTAAGGLEGFITRLYVKVLERNPDKGGLNYWINQVNSGKQTVYSVATDGFFHSNEYLNKKTANGTFVKTLYRTFLDREAEAGGYNYWMNKLQNGESRDSVIKGFADSNEFANIMKTFGVGGNSVSTTTNATTATTTTIAAKTTATVKEGNAGKVEIYRGGKVVYSMSLATGENSHWQSIVDGKSTALFANFMDKDMIADHAADGLKAMKECLSGDKLVITKNGKTTTYKMTTKYTNAVNTGSGIKVGNKYADEMNDGDLFAYCCNDSKGVSVSVTFWKKQ